MRERSIFIIHSILDKDYGSSISNLARRIAVKEYFFQTVNTSK